MTRFLLEKFYQYVFFRQWRALKGYANEKGVAIIGDMPIYLTGDSCDVWCNQDQFKLDSEGSRRLLRVCRRMRSAIRYSFGVFRFIDWRKFASERVRLVDGTRSF